MKLRPFPLGPQAVRTAQRFFDLFGFQLIDYRPPCSEIKDAQFYRPMFSPWLSSEWSERLRANDPRSLVPLHSKYILYCLALDSTRRCSGEVAECGVYKGGTAKILAELVPDRPLHLFDTFCGMPETDPSRDLHKAGDFADTTLESVRDRICRPAQHVLSQPGSRGFEDVAMQSHLGQPSLPFLGWGTTFFDMDNDGWLDLFVACGHVYPQMDDVKGSAAYAQPMLLHRNLRNGTFEEVSKAAGLADMPLKSRRGAAFGDIANNGNVDIVVLNVGEPPSLLLNTNKIANHRVLFRLAGTKSNRAAIGARVTIQAGGMTQFDEVRGGGSYLSQNDLRLHFGLGSATRIDSVEVRWPTGKIEGLKDVPADKIYTIGEGHGIQDSAPFSDLPAHLP